MSRKVVHLTPSLPPAPDGVGSFALLLAGALVHGHELESEFLVSSPAWEPEPGSEVVARKVAPDAAALEDELRRAVRGEAAVLVHYANYGYERRGCPAWLVEGLKRWKAHGGARLATVFHEVSATGPPWRSSFWLAARQRRLAADLARASDGVVASLNLTRGILQRWIPGREIPVLPVFSNVGEDAGPPLAERAPRLIVFGGAGTRELAYRTLKDEIAFACRALGLEEIWDIGPGGEAKPPGLPVPWRRWGTLPPVKVGQLLAGSRAGFVAYAPPFLAKSGIFAAYSGHRLLPICAWPKERREDEPPPPYWAPRPGSATDLGSLQAVANRAQAWYEGHSLARHAAVYARLLFPA